MLFADADVHGWDRFIDGIPTYLNLLLTGITIIIGMILKGKMRENTELTQKGVQKVEEGVRKVEEVKSDARDAKQTAAAAITIAKRTDNNVVHSGERKEVQHEELKADLQVIKHELNGGFESKVQQVMAPTIDRIETKINELIATFKESKL